MDHSTPALRFKSQSSEADPVSFAPQQLIVAGWAGRDQAAIEHHIQELEAIGVRRPRAVPLFYRVAASLLTTAPEIQVAGPDSSGEAEAVLINCDGTLWVGIGSDHTDRKVEAYGVTISKQVCAKPVGPQLWRFAEVEPHWDQLILASYVVERGERVLYQQGSMSTLRGPRDLIALFEQQGGQFGAGSAMLCGTVPVHGGFKPSERFDIELHDPVLQRTLTHSYAVSTLAIAD